MGGPIPPLVLIVDDEPLITALLTLALEKQGISVIGAHSARDAAQLFEEHRSSIKVLVTDVIMPGENGIELAQRLVAEKPGLKVLFVSGYCSTYERQLKGSECLSKPFRADEVVRRIRSLLEAPGKSTAASAETICEY
jgi:DNA-binding response OmpR family regulator